jgi:hypothetical protein
MERKNEIEELMHMLMTRYDLLSKHEFHEKKKLLEEKHKEIEEALASNMGDLLDGKNALCAEDLMGLEKRRAMTLAEQAFALTKEDLEREQAEAAAFVHRMNEKRAEMDRRKKDHTEKEERRLKELEEKAKRDKEEKDAKQKEEKKKKVELLEVDIARRNEERKKEKEETAAKIKEVLNRKPLYKLKEEKMQEIENNELEKKKEQLKRLRSLSKPIDLTELAQHRQKYFEAKSQKDRELTDRREKILLEIDDKNKVDVQQRAKYNLLHR